MGGYVRTHAYTHVKHPHAGQVTRQQGWWKPKVGGGVQRGGGEAGDGKQSRTEDGSGRSGPPPGGHGGSLTWDYRDSFQSSQHSERAQSRDIA